MPGQHESQKGSDPVTDWLNQMDDPRQATEVFGRIYAKFKAQLDRVVARRIHPQYQSLVSAESAVNKAFLEWRDGHRQGKHRVADRRELWKFLVTIASHRVRDRIRQENCRRPNDQSPGHVATNAIRSRTNSDSAMPVGFLQVGQLETGKPYHVVRDENAGKGKRAYRTNHGYVRSEKPTPSDRVEPTLRLLEPAIQEAVWDVSESIQDNLRDVFVLLLFHYSDAEIAELLKLEPRAVRIKISRIQRFLEENASRQPLPESLTAKRRK